MKAKTKIGKSTTKTVRLAKSQADYDLHDIREAWDEIEANGWTSEDIDPSEMEETDEHAEYEAAWDRLQSACKLMGHICMGSEIEEFATAILFGEPYMIRALPTVPKNATHVNVLPW
jgi:hypothetical protein